MTTTNYYIAFLYTDVILHLNITQLQSKLNTVKSTSDDGQRSVQDNYIHKQQLPSPDIFAKTLLDLQEKENLTIDHIKEDYKDSLNALIKVGNLDTCIHSYIIATFVIKTQEPVDGFTEEEQLDKAAQVTVSKQSP